ncbi:hypothetical protein F2Q68_00033946 [Brassica cretica]|uniref:Uncharacterized protein n=1 Tax=Brassica cretica TaxID=69181 RepID=A0A8S9HBE5_BRACR|nr:hypothetical protein F2Q68_00033946 [Brassica cretica]
MSADNLDNQQTRDGDAVDDNVRSTPAANVTAVNLNTAAFEEVHAQQYKKQQGNSTAILARSCKLGAFNPKRSAFLIDRQQHLFVAQFPSTTVDPGTSLVDRHSFTTVNRRHSHSVPRYLPSNID